jgi:threonine/homoserine/homoserine lactone efflux protein
MISGDIVGFIAAGVALLVSPGPATLSMAATAAAFPPGVAWSYYFGLLGGLVFVPWLSRGWPVVGPWSPRRFCVCK